MKVQYHQHAPTEPLEKIGPNGRIGLVALATDINIETDLRRMAPDGVEIFTNRVFNRNPTTVENLKAMAPDITRAANGILPEKPLDVLMYACTSGTAVIGESEVMRLLRAGRAADETAVNDESVQNQISCTTPVTAVLTALEHFSARRISILTPYIQSVNQKLVEFFQSRDIEIINIHGFGMENDTDMTGVSHDSIFQAAITACHEHADLLFISCTALRAAEVVSKIENKINKPVITSNQAMMWHALKLLQRPFQVHGFGRLFQL